MKCISGNTTQSDLATEYVVKIKDILNAGETETKLCV
jgi:hypothetical protein